jgi:hypothetical protein
LMSMAAREAHYTINTASDADNLKIEQKHTY